MPAEAGISYLFKLDTFISYDKDTIFHRMKIKILFVCHGNICRSPMAEFVMKKLVRDLPASLTAAFPAELQQGAAHPQLNEKLADIEFEIASAATSTEEIGNPVYPPARRMLATHGIDCSGKTARQMTVRDYEYYDYIVLMDRNNLRNLRWILPADVYAREIRCTFLLTTSLVRPLKIPQVTKFPSSWIGWASAATWRTPGTPATFRRPGTT